LSALKEKAKALACTGMSMDALTLYLRVQRMHCLLASYSPTPLYFLVCAAHMSCVLSQYSAIHLLDAR